MKLSSQFIHSGERGGRFDDVEGESTLFLFPPILLPA